MKTAHEWAAEGKCHKAVAQAIQADALRHAAMECRKIATDIPSADFEQARHYCADWLEAQATRLESKVA